MPNPEGKPPESADPRPEEETAGAGTDASPPAQDAVIQEASPADGGSHVIDATAEETPDKPEPPASPEKPIEKVHQPHENFIRQITERASGERADDPTVHSTKLITVTREEIRKIVTPIQKAWVMPDWVLVVEREVDEKPAPENEQEEIVERTPTVRSRLVGLAVRSMKGLRSVFGPPEEEDSEPEEQQPSRETVYSAFGLMTLTPDKAQMVDHFKVVPGTLQYEFAQQVLGVLFSRTGDFSKLCAAAGGAERIRFETIGKLGHVMMAEVTPGPSEVDSKGRGTITGSAKVTNLTRPQENPSTMEGIILRTMPKRTLTYMVGKMQ